MGARLLLLFFNLFLDIYNKIMCFVTSEYGLVESRFIAKVSFHNFFSFM